MRTRRAAGAKFIQFFGKSAVNDLSSIEKGMADLCCTIRFRYARQDHERHSIPIIH